MSAFNYDHAAAAVVYSESNSLSWVQALLLPAAQAIANIKLADRQKDHWDDISDDKKDEITRSVSRYVGCIENQMPLFDDAYDDVPEAAEYVPIEPVQLLRDTIADNTINIPGADAWARCINRLHEQNDIIRSIALDSRYVSTMDNHSRSVSDMMRGNTPISDMREILGDVAEASCLLGKIGGCGHMTARAVGVSFLRMKAEGRAEHRNLLGTLNRDVSPISRQADIREMMHTPEQRLNLAVTQAQLIQNSLQNFNNAKARKPPAELAKLQVRLNRCVTVLQSEMAKVAATNGYVPNDLATLQPFTPAVGDVFGGGQVRGVQGAGPDLPRSAYNSPSVGGNYQQQNVNPSSARDSGSKSGLG